MSDNLLKLHFQHQLQGATSNMERCARVSRGPDMNEVQMLLSELHQARLDRLKEISAEHGLSKNGSVEVVRSRLIAALVLSEWDLSSEAISSILNNKMGELLAVFGIKKSGSIRERRQRLYLHLNHDAKQLTPEKLDGLSRDDLHELCIRLELPRSGAKQALLMRVAGVLTSQAGAWGVVKKSLRRPRNGPRAIHIPVPEELDYEEELDEIVPEIDQLLIEEVVKEPVVIEEIAVDEVIEEISVAETEPQRDEVEIIELPEPLPVEVTPDLIDIEITPAFVENENRAAEIDALCRDFLLVGEVTDLEDVEAFVASFADHGFEIDDESGRAFIHHRLKILDQQAKEEMNAMHSTPNSWREREALRKFEDARNILRETLPGIIQDHSGNMVKGRMAFEEKARTLGLDLRLPAISGRLHALFDLQISLDDDIASSDPKTARRTRVIRLIQHGAVHLEASDRRTLDRLERNIEGFEQLVEAILEKSEGNYNESQQALVVRFLEKKGYEINTPELRPRIVAAAGVVGAELGYISPSEIPRLAPGINVSDTEVDSIITDLRRLAKQFQAPEREEEIVEGELDLGETVSDATDRINSARSSLDGVDELLARLRLTR